MEVKWLIDSYFVDRQLSTGFPFLADAVKAAGFAVGIDVMPEDWSEHDCIVIYGTKKFNIKWSKFPCIPGSYYRLPLLAYSGFSPHYHQYMLNDHFVLIPFAVLKKRGINKRTFIRPDKTTKAFTGMTVDPDNFEFEMSSLEQVTSVMYDTLCVVSDAKEIQSEFRFVIVDGKVVTGSEYRWDNKLDIRSDILPAAQELAEIIAKDRWQPDRVYVCDICMHKDKAYLLELNPFSSSGLYSCDTNKIVKAVSEAAWKEHQGEYDF